MERGLLIRSPTAGWGCSAFEQLFPGGHAAVFGHHRIALAAEDAGFEVRDCIVAMGLRMQHRIWLLRKPCSEATVAAQVLKTGTGALWIDGCRVQYQNEAVTTLPVGTGRWPTNVLLVHGPECRETGTKKVGSSRGGIRTTALGLLNDDAWRPTAQKDVRPWASAQGLETVPTWACEPGCAVAALDRQSGTLKTNAGKITPKMASMGFHGGSGSARKDDTELDAWLLRLMLGGT